VEAAALLAGCLAAAAAVSAVERVMVKKSGLGMVAGERRGGTREWWRARAIYNLACGRLMMAAAVATVHV